jgi:diacylglycerol O-acyltransferase / wax synthase
LRRSPDEDVEPAVHKLAGADSLFVFNETATRHQHTLKIAIVDPTGSDAPVTYDALRDQMQEALPLLEPFHWRLVKIPLNIAHPYWVDVDRVDMDYHVQHAAVPPPGGPRELADVISMIASVGLDADRPLWQVWFVEGLADGHVAYVAKIHHSLADGMSSARLLAEIAADRADTTPMPQTRDLVGEPIPGRGAMFRRGLRDLTRLLLALPPLLLRTWRWSRALRTRARAGEPRAAKPFAGPHTRFDRPLTPNRLFAYETFELAEIKDIAKAFDARVTDVALAMASGALRRYLARHGDLPDRSLTAAVPVSVRKPEEEREWGNRVASWYVSLASDVDDPAERMHAIVRGTRTARAELNDTDPELQHLWAEYWRLFRLATFAFPRMARPFLHRPSYNVIVSTVPGPPRPLFRHGARLAHVISMGPLVEGMGINFTAWSYAGEMTIAVMSCREHAPDLWDITADLRAGLDELKIAARATRISD